MYRNAFGDAAVGIAVSAGRSIHRNTIIGCDGVDLDTANRRSTVRLSIRRYIIIGAGLWSGVYSDWSADDWLSYKSH